MPTQVDSQIRIFISHSHADSAYSRALVNELRRSLGASDAVWYDEHNLGWGQIRTVIEKELEECQHFVALLSPAAIASRWVNAEIDAALELLDEGKMHSVIFLTASPCDVPRLLRGYKRIERTDGSAYPAQEAAARILAALDEKEGYDATGGNAPPEILPPRLLELGFRYRLFDGIGLIVPPLCLVPAGTCLVGSDKSKDSEAYEGRETPQRQITLPDYRIGRYHVTVAEYACFVRAAGSPPQAVTYYDRHVNWAQQLEHPDNPVTCINWFEARDYAAWISQYTRQTWRLPSQAEWEKAARWDPVRNEARIYPWGNTYNPAAFRGYNSQGTTPVGRYPLNVSPCGAFDMAGLVLHWTSTHHVEPYSKRQVELPEEMTGSDMVSTCGGSWNYGSSPFFYRSAYSLPAHADTRGIMIGFRLILPQAA